MTIGAPTETSPAERESSGLPEDQDHLTVIHGRLPGDINYTKENFSFHFPIVTCLLLSALLTLLLWLFRK